MNTTKELNEALKRAGRTNKDIFEALQDISPDFNNFVKAHEHLSTEEIKTLYNIKI